MIISAILCVRVCHLSVCQCVAPQHCDDSSRKEKCRSCFAAQVCVCLCVCVRKLMCVCVVRTPQEADY